MNGRTSRLVLKRETLTSLDAGALAAVAGGAADDTHTPTCYTGPTNCGICDFEIYVRTLRDCIHTQMSCTTC